MKKWKRRLCMILILLAILYSVLLQPIVAYASNSSLRKLQEDLTQQVEQSLESIDFEDMNIILDAFSEEQLQVFNSNNFSSKIGAIIKGDIAVKYDSFFQGVLSQILMSILRYAPMFALIVGIGILSSLLNNIKSKNNEKGVGDIIHFVCFCLVIIVSATAITNIMQSTTNAINSMKTQMDITFPILLTLTAGLGANSSVAVYQPAVALLSSGIIQIFSKIIFPIFILSFVFCIVGNLSNNVKLDKYNSFLSSIFKWIIGIVFTTFFAFLTIQGLSASSFDSVSIRTAKFTLKSYVPILGGYLSEGFDLIMSSTILVKNAVGLVGMIVLIISIITPILNIVVFSLMLKAVSAILQPLSDNRISSFLQDCSKSITMLLTCIIGIAFMYFLSTGLIMATANVL
ncbi:MAG: stage III sporulation protein AE [Clostridia bacterium]|nr:stage III sporulation protein AE [Clostridia bacterium]